MRNRHIRPWMIDCSKILRSVMDLLGPNPAMRTHPALIFPHIVAESLVATRCDLCITPCQQFDTLSVCALHSIKVGNGVAAMVGQVLGGTL